MRISEETKRMQTQSAEEETKRGKILCELEKLHEKLANIMVSRIETRKIEYSIYNSQLFDNIYAYKKYSLPGIDKSLRATFDKSLRATFRCIPELGLHGEEIRPFRMNELKEFCKYLIKIEPDPKNWELVWYKRLKDD